MFVFVCRLGTPRTSSIPLNSPVHSSVRDQERRCDVEHLVSKTKEGVKDGGMAGSSQGALAVRRERVTGDTLGSRAACSVRISFRLWFLVASEVLFRVS